MGPRNMFRGHRRSRDRAARARLGSGWSGLYCPGVMGRRAVTWFPRGLALFAAIAVAACAPPASDRTAPPSAATSPSPIALRTAPANLGCDTIGVGYRSVTFHIDRTTAEQVSVTTDTGRSLLTYWSTGFRPGAAVERVVRDPAGQVVVTDGQVLPIPQAAWPRLHVYFVCPSPNALYVLLVDPS
jgi:hypothetical protein